MIFIILWRRLFQAPSAADEKKNWKGEKMSLNLCANTYVFIESNEFSWSILHLLRWITTNYGMPKDLCVCVCVCACVREPRLGDVPLQRQSWEFLAPQMDHENGSSSRSVQGAGGEWVLGWWTSADSAALTCITFVVPHKPETRLFWQRQIIKITRNPVSK